MGTLLMMLILIDGKIQIDMKYKIDGCMVRWHGPLLDYYYGILYILEFLGLVAKKNISIVSFIRRVLSLLHLCNALEIMESLVSNISPNKLWGYPFEGIHGVIVGHTSDFHMFQSKIIVKVLFADESIHPIDQKNLRMIDIHCQQIWLKVTLNQFFWYI